MIRRAISRGIGAAGLCAAIFAGPARADFEITLREGATLVAKSYRIEGGELIAYRAGGELRIPAGRVTNVRDLGAAPTLPPARPPVAPADPPDAAASPMPPAPTHSIVTQGDAAERDRELARASILAHRALLFAKNRGEAPDEIRRRKNAIAAIEAERASIRDLRNGR